MSYLWLHFFQIKQHWMFEYFWKSSSAVLQTCCAGPDGHIIKWIQVRQTPSFRFPCCFHSFNHPFIFSHLPSHYSHSFQMYILLPSQTQHNPLHSWLQAPNLAHQPVQHTHCSLRCRTGWAWPLHRTAGAWKPANTHIACTVKTLWCEICSFHL